MNFALGALLLLLAAEARADDETSYTPLNLCIRFVTNNTALVQWVEPVTLRAEIIGYKVYYTTDPDRPLKEWDFQTIGNSPLTTLRDMDLGEMYTFRIQVRSLGLEGPGPISDHYKFRMLNRSRSCYDHPQSNQIISPNVLRAAATSPTSVEVWWNLPYDPHHVSGFVVYYGRNTSNNSWRSRRVGLTQSVELDNLEPGAVYKVAIAAATNSGLEFYSQETSVRVAPEEVPLAVKVYDVTSTTITLEWEPPVKINPTKYKIAYDAVKDYVDSAGIHQHFRFERQTQVIDGYFKAYELHNLKPFTTYNINISAIPVDSSYRPSARVSAMTEVAPPSSILRPDIAGVTPRNNVKIILPKASEEYGPISHYFVVVVPQTSPLELPTAMYTTEELLRNEWDEGEEVDAPYIAAKFSAKIPYAFMLGSEEQSGFKNYRLDVDKRYKVYVRAVVKTLDGEMYTDSPYSDNFSLSEEQFRAKSRFNAID